MTNYKSCDCHDHCDCVTEWVWPCWEWAADVSELVVDSIKRRIASGLTVDDAIDAEADELEAEFDKAVATGDISPGGTLGRARECLRAWYDDAADDDEADDDAHECQHSDCLCAE